MAPAAARFGRGAEYNDELQWTPIGKPDEVRRDANLGDYDDVRQRFTWSTARTRLSGLPDGRGLNTACEAVDRHASGRPER